MRFVDFLDITGVFAPAPQELPLAMALHYHNCFRQSHRTSDENAAILHTQHWRYRQRDGGLAASLA